MGIILYLCLLLLSGAPAFVYAAELEPRHWCDPSFEGNGALRALLNFESAREYCGTYIPAPTVTITAVATEVMNYASLILLAVLFPLLLNYILCFAVPSLSFSLQTANNIRYYIRKHRTNPSRSSAPKHRGLHLLLV